MCVAKEDAFKLLQSMVGEVVSMHEKYSTIHSVHIGGDEVFEVVQNKRLRFQQTILQIGYCDEAQEKIKHLEGTNIRCGLSVK